MRENVRISTTAILTIVVALITFMLCAVSCSSDVDTNSASSQVKIMLAESEGIEIESKNPVVAEAGSDVLFDVSVMKGYKLVGVDGGAELIDDQITFTDVKYPATIHMEVRALYDFTFSVKNDNSMGMVHSSISDGKAAEDTEITVKAKAKDDYVFVGWSEESTLKNGGNILSYAAEYTFELTSNLYLYANWASSDSNILIYNANGGKVGKTDNEIICVECSTEFYYCPNTLADNGTFVRDGYVLIGYSENKDGSGYMYGLGWNVIVPESGVVQLYAQWAKATDASCFKFSGKSDITITGYNGNDRMLVIPETINGKPVSTIAKDAFENCNFESVVISKNVKSIADNAFVNCKKMTTLYLDDSVTDISDSSFVNCPNFRTLRMNAVLSPTYVSYRTGTYCIKFERLQIMNGKKLIVVAGSSSAYGITSPLLETEMDGEYSVLNYGTNAETCLLFYLDVIADFIGEGDIVVMAPEIARQQLGANMFESILWEIFEGAYEAFSFVDIRDYKDVFSSFSSYNDSRLNMTACTYNSYDNTVNKYGDFYIEKPKQSSSYVFQKNYITFRPQFITQDSAKRLNAINDLYKSIGTHFYFSFAPCNKNALSEKSKLESNQNEYVSKIKRMFEFPVISELDDYLLPGYMFYNSDYHLGTYGASVRTKQLAADIKAQLAKDETKR